MTIIWILLAVAVVVGLYVMVTYNGLVSLRNKIENAWAQIDVQLKRRYDLIPNLVETVKGYAAHERETLDAVIRARNSAMAASGPTVGSAKLERPAAVEERVLVTEIAVLRAAARDHNRVGNEIAPSFDEITTNRRNAGDGAAAGGCVTALRFARREVFEKLRKRLLARPQKDRVGVRRRFFWQRSDVQAPERDKRTTTAIMFRQPIRTLRVGDVNLDDHQIGPVVEPQRRVLPGDRNASPGHDQHRRGIFLRRLFDPVEHRRPLLLAKEHDVEHLVACLGEESDRQARSTEAQIEDLGEEEAALDPFPVDRQGQLVGRCLGDGFVSSYCNTVPTGDGGTHEQGLRAALLRGLRNYAELSGNKRAAQLTAEDVLVQCSAMLSVFVREPEFVGQTKDKLSSPEATRIVDTALRDPFDHWLAASPNQASKLLDWAIERAEERVARQKDPLAHDDTGLAGEAAVHLGHDRADLLVADQDGLDLARVVKRVEDAPGVAAGHAEDELDAGLLEDADQRVGNVDLVGDHAVSSSTSIAASRRSARPRPSP